MPWLTRDERKEKAAAEQRKRDAKEKARRDDAEREAERQERKLLRELQQLEAKGKVDPPPELPPAERLARENAERLDRIEGNRRPLNRHDLLPLPSPEQNRRKEALRMLRIRRDYEHQEKFERELGIAKAQKRAEDEQTRITAARDGAVAEIRARAEDECKQAREQADADVAASWESFERTARAKLEKAPTEVRELLERLNHRLRRLREVVEA